MYYSVLVIDNDEKALDITLKELSSRGMNAIGCTNFDSACEKLKDDGTIHAVLTEWLIPMGRKDKKRIEGVEMFKTFFALRNEVNIFIHTSITDIRKLSTKGLTDGYFFKDDVVFDDIVSKITAAVAKKNSAPFYEKLVEYARKSKDSWHTPGHASGNSVKNSPYVRDYYDFFGENLFKSDVSVSVPELDSLLHPVGVIQDAQELAARAFNARYTFFVTNGTSTANKVLIQTLLRPGDAILLDRNCHKSVHYGVIIAGAEPLYLMPSVNNKYGIFGPIPKKVIINAMDEAIAQQKKLKAIILTNCTYDGLIYDIEDIVKEAHKRNIKVIVDEAWFGHANFHREFYPTAMAAGADYATQSTHKTMSAFSQSSMIHVNDPDFEDIQDFFMENYNMHASTSPQYPMIASLDVARKQMVMEGYGLLSRAFTLSDELKASINSLSMFSVLEREDLISDEIKDDNIRLDKTKLTIDISKSGYTSKEIEHLLLTKHNVQIEKTTFNTLTVLLTIGATYSRINRLYLALESIEKNAGNRMKLNENSKVLKDFKLSLSPIKYRPRFAFYANSEGLPLRDCLNRVSTMMVTPYPPGIPLLVPGQLISDEIINALVMYRDYGVEIHGLHNGLIQVMPKDEEDRLKNEGYSIMS